MPAAFGTLWAVALLHHQIAYRAVLASAVDAGLVLAALAVLLRPWSAGRLALLAALPAAPRSTRRSPGGCGCQTVARSPRERR